MAVQGIDSNAILAQMRALTSEARGAGMEMPKAIETHSTSPASAVNFGDVLGQAVDFVNTQQQSAGQLAKRFEQGDNDVNLADVMIQIQKANISFQAATQVRNRLVSAYQDIMNMPI